MNTTTTATTTIFDCIPSDVCAEVVLHMLEVHDLTSLEQQRLNLPVGVTFVAKRVLSAAELDWFADNGISLALFVDRVVQWGVNNRLEVQWLLNGELHRDNDLPAIEDTSGNRYWYCHGKLHRDNDRPAIELADGTRAWYQMGVSHRDGGQPAVIWPNYNYCEWYRHGELLRVGGNNTKSNEKKPSF